MTRTMFARTLDNRASTRVFSVLVLLISPMASVAHDTSKHRSQNHSACSHGAWLMKWYVLITDARE